MAIVKILQEMLDNDENFDCGCVSEKPKTKIEEQEDEKEDDDDDEKEDDDSDEKDEACKKHKK